MSATNLELSIVTSFETSIESEGSITVPAKAILNFLQYNHDPEVLLEAVEGTQIQLHSRRAKASISGEASANFPSIPTIESHESIDLPAQQFLQALQLVTFACAKTTSRPVLAGVSFERSAEGVVTLVGTDSYRLSEYVIQGSTPSTPLSCIIPSRFLEELKAILSFERDSGDGSTKAPSTIRMLLTPQQIEVTLDHTRLISRLIEGKFPDYRQILPKESTCTITASARELLDAIKRMHYFAKEQSNNILFRFADGSIHLSTRQTQIGRDESVIPAAMEGSGAKIALSSAYIIDFLSRTPEDIVVLKIQDHLHPILFHIPGSAHFLHLVMPLRMIEE